MKNLPQLSGLEKGTYFEVEIIGLDPNWRESDWVTFKRNWQPVDGWQDGFGKAGNTTQRSATQG